METVDAAAIVLSAEYIAVGLTLLLAANRLPPNPILGARIGYAYSSRAAWRSVNRLVAVALLLLGVVGLVVEYTAGGLPSLFIVLVSTPVLLLMASIYSERVAERAGLSEEGGGAGGLVEARLPRALTAPVLFGLAFIVAAEAYTLLIYPRLPSTLAVHFSASGTPDRFLDKHLWLGVSLALTLFVAGMDVFAFIVVMYKPIVLYKPWYRVSDLRLAAAAFALLSLFISVVMAYSVFDVAYYNIHGVHVAPVAVVVATVAVVLAPMLAVFTYLMAKATKRWLSETRQAGRGRRGGGV